MISAEGEEIPFDNVLIPADAKGMVEKWLDQVGDNMISCLRNVIERAVKSYPVTDRSKWVQEWPGQVRQLWSCIHDVKFAVPNLIA